MVFITDKVPVKNGADYTFVCSRIPFAVSCSSNLPHGEYNLIDMDLVLKMKIPLQRIRVERYPIMGEIMRAVGVISQTVQCVQQGRVSGNIHIQAKVVRDLYNMYNVDCIASSKTYTCLVGKEPTKPPDDIEMDLDEDGEDFDLVDDGDDNINLVDDGDDNINLKEDAEGEEESKVTVIDIKTSGVKPNVATEEDVNQVDDKEDDDHDTPVSWQDHQNQYGSNVTFGATSSREVYHSAPQGGYEAWYTDEPLYPKEKNDLFCKLCFTEGEPVSVVHSHHTLDISCPSMTDEEKEKIYGPDWIPKMFGYYDT